MHYTQNLVCKRGDEHGQLSDRQLEKATALIKIFVPFRVFRVKKYVVLPALGLACGVSSASGHACGPSSTGMKWYTDQRGDCP